MSIALQKNKWFGAHVSAAGGPQYALQRAVDIEANALALFTKNQRQWSAKALNIETINLFKDNLKKFNILPEQVLPHGSYLINLGSPNQLVLQRSFDALCDELARVNELGLCALNIHPGSSLGMMSDQACLSQIAHLMTEALKKTSLTTIVLENTAGQGSNLGYRLEHLSEIISNIPEKFRFRVGVCIDTCHAFAAGYDLSTFKKCEDFFELLYSLVGSNGLKGMHLNDSKGTLGSRIDRHEVLGKGHIGRKIFEYIAKDTRFCNIPLILETPDPNCWIEEIRWLRKQASETSSIV